MLTFHRTYLCGESHPINSIPTCCLDPYTLCLFVIVGAFPVLHKLIENAVPCMRLDICMFAEVHMVQPWQYCLSRAG